MLPLNTNKILDFINGYVAENDFSTEIVAGVINLTWYSQDPQPTEQEIIDAGNDLTVVNGQTFSQWFAENGGDNALTERRKGVEAIDVPEQYLANLIRAVALVTMEEINILRGIAGQPDRTFTQLRNAIKNKIDSGEVDN